jgi:hypothetical protein
MAAKVYFHASGECSKKVEHDVEASKGGIIAFHLRVQDFAAVEPAFCEHDSVIALPQKGAYGHIPAHQHAGFRLHSHLQDSLYVMIQHVTGKSIFSDNISEYASQFRFGFI